MPVKFAVDGVKFDATQGEVQVQTRSVPFGSHVIKAAAALNGVDVRFTGSEHPLHRLIIDITDVTPRDHQVDVTVRYLLRDHSGNIDDTFQGVVDFLVIAEVD
jgi:hypothetical protein